MCLGYQYACTAKDMRTYTSIVFFTSFVLSHCVTIHWSDEVDIISKKIIELNPMHITGVLSDLIVISAPIVPNARYYLYNPNGDPIKLNISRPTYPAPEGNTIDNQYDSIVIKYADQLKGIYPLSDYKVFNLCSKDADSNETFEKYANKMYANDFIIGPLTEEDHGNWAISAYSQDKDGNWTEVYRVITIEIIEYIPPKPRIAKLREGDTFEFSFAHPIAQMTSCELTAPRSTFDRFYERDHINMGSCGYIIKNVTKQDQGTWRIMGVGRVNYGTQVYLEVLNGVAT
ncbi:unnamed protein product [Chilo suppressalis]|uniref:Uncharacterized protein n=1 Tax=Chilo suppressalis TaxID=168631 RepID=A0ABN8B0R2_CHISP|nr:hypothetical protein evm_006032 [Chilo suppressalis]CAH0402453.1 unnamed protein product [Chilo suppressalis]